MVTKGNIHNMTNWPQSVSTSSCAIRKGLKYIECHTQCIYCTRMATTWRSDCLTEVKVIKSSSVGPRKRLRGADEGQLNSGPLNAGLTLIAFTRQLTWSCKGPWLVHVTYGLVFPSSRCSRATTAKKCTKKRDGRAKLLFCQSYPTRNWRSRCRRRRRCRI